MLFEQGLYIYALHLLPINETEQEQKFSTYFLQAFRGSATDTFGVACIWLGDFTSRPVWDTGITCGQHGSICFSLSQEVHSETRCYYVGRCRCELGGQCPSLFRCTCCRFMWISWDTFSRATSCGLSSILWRVLQIQISRPLFQKLWCGPSVASLLILNKSPGSAKKHVTRATQLQKFSQSLYYGTFGRLKKCKGII